MREMGTEVNVHAGNGDRGEFTNLNFAIRKLLDVHSERTLRLERINFEKEKRPGREIASN